MITAIHSNIILIFKMVEIYIFWRGFFLTECSLQDVNSDRHFSLSEYCRLENIHFFMSLYRYISSLMGSLVTHNCMEFAIMAAKNVAFDCIFGLDAGKEAGFITCARTGRIWFKTNQHDEPKQLSRSNSNAICHLRAVQRIELKPFKATTIQVAYAKRAMSKRWNGSQVHCITHLSL